MRRTAFFIDGFNLYHSLREQSKYHKFKWLDLNKLSKAFISSNDSLVDVFYFTAYAKWNPQKEAKHKIYINALRAVGVKPIFGAFRKKDVYCPRCRKTFQAREEKRTDVNIAIKLFETAMDDSWDKALIISGDSDLIPAIEAIKASFPAKQIGIIIPIGKRAEELKNAADSHIKMKEKHLQSCQFPDTINVSGFPVLIKPSTWV